MALPLPIARNSQESLLQSYGKGWERNPFFHLRFPAPVTCTYVLMGL